MFVCVGQMFPMEGRLDLKYGLFCLEQAGKNSKSLSGAALAGTDIFVVFADGFRLVVSRFFL